MDYHTKEKAKRSPRNLILSYKCTMRKREYMASRIRRNLALTKKKQYFMKFLVSYKIMEDDDPTEI
jgi:hypothetical protein